MALTILSDATIRRLGVFSPHRERERHAETGLTGGLSCCGYDIHLAEDVELRPGEFALASAQEYFVLPDDVVGIVHDKSSLARQGLSVFNTVAEPGWRGYLTLELANQHSPAPRSWLRGVIGQIMFMAGGAWAPIGKTLAAHEEKHTIRLVAGQPIAQVILHRLDAPAERPYRGRYQDQAAGPQPARPLEDGEKA